MTPYGQSALDAEVAAVRSTGGGGRNGQLNKSAFAVAQLVAGEQIDAEPARAALREAAGDTGLDRREIEATIASGWKAGMDVPRYPYRDAGGQMLYAKARVDRPARGNRAGQKYAYQHLNGRGEWKEGRNGAEPVPYRLPDLANATPGTTLYMAEGEKQADKLASWGLLATSLKDWKASFGAHVAGRIVVILPDNDTDGAKQAAKVHDLVEQAGGRPLLIDLPGLPHKGDIMDWSGDRAALERLVVAARSAPMPKPGLAFSKGITAAALMDMQFAPINYVVPGYITEGLTVFAGAPKIGKSWWALGVALAVASGLPAFGTIPVTQGDVLYLALEDNPRRLKRRMIHMGIQTPPSRLTFNTEWPNLDDGCLDEIEAWIAGVEKPTLIVVDVLTKVRGETNSKDSAYEADYRTLTGLQTLAGIHGLAVVVVHHTRKMEAEDPFDGVSGTRGLTGAADTVLVLKRDSGTQRTILYGRGRDVEEIETAFEFQHASGTWRVIGAAHEVAKTDERQIILDTLRAAPNPLSAREVSDLIGKSYETIRRTITRMVHSGEVERQGQGRYSCPTCPTVPLSPHAVPSGTGGTGGTGGTRVSPSWLEERDPADEVFGDGP